MKYFIPCLLFLGGCISSGPLSVDKKPAPVGVSDTPWHVDPNATIADHPEQPFVADPGRPAWKILGILGIVILLLCASPVIGLYLKRKCPGACAWVKEHRGWPKEKLLKTKAWIQNTYKNLTKKKE